MITAIPNQPIDFIGSSILVECPDKRLPMLATSDDTLRFQVGVDAPTGEYAYGDALRNWVLGTEWDGPGPWEAQPSGVLCMLGPTPAPGAYIEPIVNTFTPTTGETYLFTLEVQSIGSVGVYTFSMGGQSFTITAPGTYSFTVTAATSAAPRITQDTAGGTVCFSNASIYTVLGGEDSCGILVQLVEAGEFGNVLYSMNSADTPELFTVSSGVIGVELPLAIVNGLTPNGCVYLRVTYYCNDETVGEPLCSQPIQVDGDCTGTVVVRSCLDRDGLGFIAPAIFEVRLKASLVRPRWEVDSSEERWSDGTINRYYVDRQRVSDLLIQPVDEVLHPFLSALCVFDHVYINGTEYSVGADGYDPGYGEQTGTAGVQLTVRPKRELFRRVTCDEPGPGCAPENDPPCVAPNAFVNYEYDGGYMVIVNVYSALGFTPDRVQMYVDDVLTDDEAWTTPATFTFGPVPDASVVRVEITNLDVPECDWSTEFTLPGGPCADYPIMPTMLGVDFIATADQQATIEGGSLTIGWSFLIQDLPDATPPGSTLWEQNTGNVAYYAGPGAGEGGSDWNIDVIAPGTVIDVLANGASPDYDKWWVVRGAASGTTLYPSGKMALQWLYPARSSDDDPSPGSRVFDRSFLTLERADSNDLSECRRCFVEISSNEVDWFPFGNYNEVDAMTGGQHQLDDVYARVTWYGGPTGTDVQGVSIVRYFPV